MFDRTAHKPQEVGQRVWDYETGRKVARGLQDAGAAWLEEPFARDDYVSPARLAAEMELPITGGEGYVGLDGFRECVTHKTYDILQPEGSGCGGILTCVKVAALAQAFRLPCILHGSMSLRLAGWLQATLAIGSRMAGARPGHAPPAARGTVVAGVEGPQEPEVFTIEDGMILAPEHPGLGLDVDEEAIERFRTRIERYQAK